MESANKIEDCVSRDNLCFFNLFLEMKTNEHQNDVKRGQIRGFRHLKKSEANLEFGMKNVKL